MIATAVFGLVFTVIQLIVLVGREYANNLNNRHLEFKRKVNFTAIFTLSILLFAAMVAFWIVNLVNSLQTQNQDTELAFGEPLE